MKTIEKWLIILIALHSIGIGIGLLWAPDWAFRLGGWDIVTPKFFARQAGIFHLVVACCYLIEYFRYRGIIILLMAKSVATVFLLGSYFLYESSWIVVFSAVADFLMGLVAYYVHRLAWKTSNLS